MARFRPGVLAPNLPTAIPEYLNMFHNHQPRDSARRVLPGRVEIGPNITAV